MLWRSFLWRAYVFALPGILLLARGRSTPAEKPLDPPGSLAELVAVRLYPDNTPGLLVCAVLICVPALLFYRGAGYLAEMTFARVPLNTTPAILWVILSYGIAIAMSVWSLRRLLNAA